MLYVGCLTRNVNDAHLREIFGEWFLKEQSDTRERLSTNNLEASWIVQVLAQLNERVNSVSLINE